MTTQAESEFEDAVPVALADSEELESLIGDHPLVLIEFYTDGCPVCASMEPVLGSVAKVSDAVVGTINPRDDPPLVEAYSIQSVPKFVLFAEGDQVATLADGFVGVEDVLEFLDAHRVEDPGQ